MYKKIMVPLDGSKLAECVFPHLEAAIKGSDSPEVLFVRAVEPIAVPYGIEAAGIKSIEQLEAFETHNKSDAEKYLSEVVARYRKSGVNARAEVIYGKAAEALGDFATRNDVDLVVIATHGRSGISRWVWGTVAGHLLRSLPVPVLMIRPRGCVNGF